MPRCSCSSAADAAPSLGRTPSQLQVLSAICYPIIINNIFLAVATSCCRHLSPYLFAARCKLHFGSCSCSSWSPRSSACHFILLYPCLLDSFPNDHSRDRVGARVVACGKDSQLSCVACRRRFIINLTIGLSFHSSSSSPASSSSSSCLRGPTQGQTC